MATYVPMRLFGGPGDGAQVRVTGRPLPEFVAWWQADPQTEPQVTQHAFRPRRSEAGAVYRLDRRTLRYMHEGTQSA